MKIILSEKIAERLVARLRPYFFLRALLGVKRATSTAAPVRPIAYSKLIHQRSPDAAESASSPTEVKIIPQAKVIAPRSIVLLVLLLSSARPWNRRFRPMPDTAIAGVNSCNVSTITCSKFIFVTSFVDYYTTSVQGFGKQDFKIF